jgi:hypothetical protein
MWSPKTVLGPSDVPKPGSRIDCVKSCDVYGHDNLADLDETGLD